MKIGARLLSPLASREEAADGLASAPPELAGADGTLLAVVPIPGTGTSLAIVGYPVSNETVPGRGSRDDGAGGATAGRAPGRAPHSAGAIAAGAIAAGAVAASTAPGGAGLLLDHDQRRVLADGQEIPLTYQEFELLAFLPRVRRRCSAGPSWWRRSGSVTSPPTAARWTST